MLKFLFLALLVLSVYAKNGRTDWVQQLGTVEHPNTPDFSPKVKSDRVYAFENKLFRANLDGDYKELQEKYGLPKAGQHLNELWTELHRGSYINPKVKFHDAEYAKGDLYVDSNGQYFRALNTGHRELTDGFQDAKLWQKIDDKAQWMELLRDEIGDERLGDIMTPGTHDTCTEAIDENSYLVNNDILFRLALTFDPQILSNWSKTQTDTLGGQLRAGFRSFDMRIADMEEVDGTFRWWHGTTGDVIYNNLEELVTFLEENPQEIVRLDFNNFAKAGNVVDPILPIPDYRKDQIADILIEYLEPYMALQSEVGSNPTMNEILATGKNIILIMKDSYIRQKHDGFWSNVVAGSWSGRSNPEDLFLERSSRLEGFLGNNPNRMNGISGCNTPEETMVAAGLLRIFGDDQEFRDLIGTVYPELLDVEPALLSFEGMWSNLIDFVRQGTNTAGMMVRPAENYTSGASVHYRGVNDMARYWLARPQKFKVNEIHVDDATESSTLVETAILSAKKEIPREVTVTHQGNAKDGYYIWDEENVQTVGGRDGLLCTTPILARYKVTSSSYVINEDYVDLSYKSEVTFKEGQFPSDATFILEVTGPEFGEWLEIYQNNIQMMIDRNLDLYLRGSMLEEEQGGFAYTSYSYNLFGANCDSPPTGGYLQLMEWQ